MDTTTQNERNRGDYRELPLFEIRQARLNPRRHFDAAKLTELTNSIREKGVIEPIVVRPVEERAGTSWEVVAGARRVRAAVAAGLTVIPSLIRELTDVEALELAVIENTQRADVNPIDEAQGYKALIALSSKASGPKEAYTAAVIAGKVGKSESYIYRRMHLLELELELQKAVAEERLPVRYAEVLLRMTPAVQKEALDLERGCVWRFSPLFDGKTKDFVPTAEDLQPLAGLEQFARRHSALNPQAESARHLQPELGEVIEQHVDERLTDHSTAEEEAEVLADLVAVSEDSMVRMNLRADDKTPIPLAPSKWREVKRAKHRCGHEKPAVVVHGGPYRTLEICTKRSCDKHWPQAKKPKPSTSRASGSKTPTKPVESEWQRRDRLEREAQERWKPIWSLVKPALVEFLRPQKMTAALVWTLVSGGRYFGFSGNAIRAVEKEFGVKLSDKTIGLVLALFQFRDLSDREDFLESAKLFRFPVAKLDAIEKAHAAKQAAANKTDAKAKKSATPKKGKKAA